MYWRCVQFASMDVGIAAAAGRARTFLSGVVATFSISMSPSERASCLPAELAGVLACSVSFGGCSSMAAEVTDRWVERGGLACGSCPPENSGFVRGFHPLVSGRARPAPLSILFADSTVRTGRNCPDPAGRVKRLEVGQPAARVASWAAVGRVSRESVRTAYWLNG